MVKLGIIGAMSVEVEALKSRMEGLSVIQCGGLSFFEGLLEGVPAVVVVCGVGKVNAALCVQMLCDCFGVTHLVNTGVAGSLKNEINIGDIVISIEKAIEQAELYGHSLDREIAFLTVHSMLHLLGYDHEPGGLELVRMREREEAVLTQLGLVRSGSYYTME